ncbi:MAG: heparinase II/III domain-containing protein, partial [Candidatus Latescibacterota bacterium]
MHRRTFLASSAAAALTASLSDAQGKPSAEGIFPSPHPVRIAAPVKPGPTVKSRYKKFNREAVLAKMRTNERYDKLLENARGSVKQFVAMSESQLRGFIPPANTKRALMVHRKGCPVHGGGTAVYQPFGTSPDLSLPLQVKCPIGGEIYPNKDFPDDGQGWLDNRPDSPTKGERYYFVGWFNQWFLNSLPGRIRTLAQLSFLTGEEQYSRTAQILLKRFMEVYPDLDGNDLTYDGTDWGVYIKMTATMWEGGALMNLVRSVELLLPTLSDDFVRDFHAKVIRSAFEAYRAKPAPSNWGNVWNPPFAKFADVTGDREILDYLLWGHPVAAAPVLDNQYFRDGFPYEAAFSYGSHYLNDSQNIARELGVNGNWIWEHPNMRAAFPAYADLICLDRFTHFFGDTGGLTNKGLTLSTGPLEEAWMRYRTPKLARYLLQAYEVNGSSSSVSLDTLFEEEQKRPNLAELKSFAAKEPPLRCTLSPVRGFAVMRTGEGDNRTELFLDYGYAHAAHSHADRLNINIFAAGREFIPEMGYPEYMDSIAPSPGGWTTHTVCHATVEVDEKRQLEGVFGDLHAFVDAEGLKYVDTSCEDAYVHCGVKLYRRSLMLIDVPGGAYTVDIFRVRGGKRHDYLFHSMPKDVELVGPKLSAPRKGTLLGENVEFGFKREDVLPYHVDNPGYQYLYDVQSCDMREPFTARWKADDGVAFSAVFVPDKTETFLLTKGYPRPSSKTIPPMPFLVRRKDPAGPDDLSTFASVLSVEKTKPCI